MTTAMGKTDEGALEEGASEGAALSDAFLHARSRDLKERLKRRRYEHVQGVSETAAELAEAYGADVRKARLAGLLHDWDKDYDDDGIRARARDLGVADDLDPYVFDAMPRLLHGPTAAAALGRDYPGIPSDVLQSIARHTAAAIGMSDLDMIIYIADAIEPTRDFDGLVELREAAGTVPLEELFMMTFNHILLTLVERRRRLHPATVEVWNHYVSRSREAAGEKGTA